RRLKLLTGLDPSVKRELDEGHLRPRLAQELCRLPQGNDQARVLALVKRYYLTKDQTAHLIDWWQEAAEDERVQLESSRATLGDQPSAVPLTELIPTYPFKGSGARMHLAEISASLETQLGTKPL
ncbi:MAG: hypothetical protein ACYCX4_10830, partial [Bacillota bacterium]